MSGKAYYEKLKDPRWQKRRLDILSRDEWVCQSCYDSDSTLHVHHLAYRKGVEPWDYPDHMLLTLCEVCHDDFGALGYEIISAVARSAREHPSRPLLEQLLLVAERMPVPAIGGAVWCALSDGPGDPL